MPTKKTRVFFTPSDAALGALAKISASTGTPVSQLVAEMIGFCEPRLLDMAALLGELDAIRLQLAAELADYPGELLLTNICGPKLDQVEKAIARASDRLKAAERSAGIGLPFVGDLVMYGNS